MGIDLIVGGGQLERCLPDADKLLFEYRTDDGLRYLDWRPTTDPDQFMPEDLAVLAGWRGFPEGL
ncbi:hypothetical protein [Micromonospora sp. CPCC 206061]|uniref:hypothetical protein n=1 Tax=Micromonospora sp. CPCC 206061 TaxID=3122410 RepID=UPI002FF0031D